MAGNESVEPVLIFEALTAYQRSAALKGAIDLGLFGQIARGHGTAAEIASTIGASERGTRILCDYLVVAGFLTKEGSRYGLAAVSAMFLDPNSPAFMGSMSGFLNSSLITRAFDDVAATVRKGGTVIQNDGTLGPEHPVWVDFARAMGPMAGFTAEMMANCLELDPSRPYKILDIAAGHGLFGIALARRCPQLEVVGQDWRNVLSVAEENASAAGVSDRYRLLPGDAFGVDFGKDYDLVLVPNFLHHFDVQGCERLLHKISASLKPDGRVVTVEFIPNEDRVSPAAAAAFSLVMLASTPSGDAYTFAELDGMFRRSGFTKNVLHQLAPSPQQMIVSSR